MIIATLKRASYISQEFVPAVVGTVPLIGKEKPLNDEEKYALATVLLHFLISTGTSRTAFAEECKLNRLTHDGRDRRATRSIDNFLGTLTCDNDDIIKLRDKLQAWFSQNIDRVPKHIRVAANVAFRLPTPSPPPPVTDRANHDLDKVIASIEDDATLTQGAMRDYGGIWHVIRYSAHEHTPIGLPNHEWDAYVIHAAMQIRPSTSDGSFVRPMFEIHYRPNKQADTKDYQTAEGTVLSLGKREYLQFIGHDLASEYPLTIIAQQEKTLDTRFFGLVTRRHERGGQVFCSRVAFVRATGATSLEDLNDTIGAKLESVFKKQMKDEIPGLERLLERVRNSTDYGGKRGLLM
jgi:hypothetical protein